MGYGNYEFVNQHLGAYKVRAEAAGFQTAEASSFELTTNARQRVDLALKVGQASAEVTVTDAASLLETETSSRGQVIGQAQIRELPLNGRAYADLTLLSPGVAKSALENQADSSRDASFNVNGQRSELNNFMLDGVDNNSYGTSNQGFSNQVIQANPDALAEFKVETNNYSAEFGRAAGAVINATIKSGTNQFHGEAWEFLRNTVLNAQGFFKPVGGGTLPFNQNQFGGAFGGPIMKDKLFFFADYEGFRRVSHPLQFATLPTAAMDQRRFQRLRRADRESVHRHSLSERHHSAIRLYAAGERVLSALPAPNLPGNSNNYESSPADTMSNDKGDFRGDYYLNSQLDRSSPATASRKRASSIRTAFRIPSAPATPTATCTFGPSRPSSAAPGRSARRRSWKRAWASTYTIAGKTPPTLGLNTPQFNIPRRADRSFTRRRSLLRRTERRTHRLGPVIQQSAVSGPLRRRSEDRIHEDHGAAQHENRLRVSVDRYRGQRFPPAIRHGELSPDRSAIRPIFTNPSALNSLTAVQKQVYSVADFIFGADNHYELDNNPVAHCRQRMYFGYVQDDLKVNDKLTLNLGLRYEFATPQYERDNKLANFDAVDQHADLRLATAACTSARWSTRIGNNLAPRVGLAYQVTAQDRDPQPATASATCSSTARAAKTCWRTTVRTSSTPPSTRCRRQGNLRLGQPRPPEPASAPRRKASRRTSHRPSIFNTANTQVRYIPENERTPATCRAGTSPSSARLAKDLLLDVGYVGNHTSVGLIILGDENQALPNALGQNLSLAGAPSLSRISTTIEISYERRLRQLQRAADQAGEAVPQRLLLAELVHLVEGDRQRSGPPGEL